MKGFFAKKWHGIPVGIVSAVLLVCMLAGSAFAAYTFINQKIDVTVSEPMTVTFTQDGTNWYPLPLATLPIPCFAGDSDQFGVIITNKANNDISVHIKVTDGAGNVPTWFTTNLPLDKLVPARVGATPGTTGYFLITVKVSNDAPPGEFILYMTFSRS